MELLLSRKGTEGMESRYDIFKSLKGFEVHAVDEAAKQAWPDMRPIDYTEVIYFSTYRKARAFVKAEIADEKEFLG